MPDSAPAPGAAAGLDPPAGSPGLIGRWLDRYDRWRDEVLMNPAFQRWAAGFPLTRFIARRRSRHLFDLCAGFVYSQVLLACVRMELLEMLRPGPLPPGTVADRLGLSPAAALRLLRAAAALRLVSPRRGGRYGLGDLGTALVSNPCLGALVGHHALLYGDLADPVALLRGTAGPTRVGGYWPYARAESPADLHLPAVAPYTGLMAASQALIAAEVLAACPLGGYQRIMDVGGGDGSFLRAVAAHWPGPSLVLFDLPPVAAMARERFAAAGLTGRAETVGGSFLRDALPAGADLITLIRVLHDHDDEAALRLLQSVRAALPAGGGLLVAEPMAGIRGVEPVGDAYFGFYLLAMGQGQVRTPASVTQLVRTAGFRRVRVVPTHAPLLVSVVRAEV